MRRRGFLRVLAASQTLPLMSGAEPELRVAVNQTTIESASLFLQETRGVRIVPVASGRIASSQLVSGVVDAATGSETQALLAEILGTAQLHESDLHLVSMEGEAMPTALVKQEVDAMAIWEPDPQRAGDLLGDDALVLENPSLYRERFNLNTTVHVLNDPAKRRSLVSLVRAVMRVSAQLQGSPRELIGKLAKTISTPEPLIAKVWERFRFPAELDERQLRSVLMAMEPWAANISGRQPRPVATLAALIDGSVLAQARR